MEDGLAVYQRPYDPRRPVVCMDETSKQLIGEVRYPLPGKPAQPKRYDTEYKRNGVANIFMAFEPLAGKRWIRVTDHRTAVDWAHYIQYLVNEHYSQAEVIVLVMDNLNTHKKASLYQAFEPQKAKRLADKLEIHYTPKHGSWLNMAEIELSHLSRQCLDRRLDNKSFLEQEVAAWQATRNACHTKTNWQFTVKDARIKLKRLYPSF